MQDIQKTFPGVRALKGVQLRVKPGSIHALMGENGAGKSTLMKCLFGIYRPDAGRILLDGEEVQIPDSRAALKLGISMIHQELHPIAFRPVMENIFLGRFPRHGFVVDEREMQRRTKELLDELEISVSPTQLMGELSVSGAQSVEIAKAISYRSRIIVMDEPTSSLTDHEVEHLFKLMRRQRDAGTSIIYISHKMEEILEIADEVTIMRDGEYVGTWPAQELSTDLIISRMVGRNIENRFPPRQHVPREDVSLRVQNLTGADAHSFTDVSFDLHRGEILGVGGLVGAGRTELVEAIFGLRSIRGGSVLKDGRRLTPGDVRGAMRSGLALLTEERRATGIVPVLSVMENAVLANQPNYARFGVLNEQRRRNDAEESCRTLRVKTPNLQALIQNLSGGNQQKVLIARWLLTDPDVLILDEPTRGIDVGAKYEIYSIMSDLVKQGKSIIMISSEMPELLGMSDRILVMCDGRLSGVLKASEATQVDVMRLATQFRK